jgi:hypothetical protein
MEAPSRGARKLIEAFDGRELIEVFEAANTTKPGRNPRAVTRTVIYDK